MIIEYKGVQVFYTTSGSGKPLVLLHGFLETSKIWEPFLEELSVKRRVICIDLPGHGNTGIFGEVHSMELMADVVNSVLEELDIPEATILGHSMGGYVGLAFAEKFPAKLSGLALMNSTPEADSEERKIIRDRTVELVKKNKNAYIKIAISNLVAPDNRLRFKREIEDLKQEAYKFESKGIIACLMGMKIRTDRTDLLKHLTSYKIMISGREDPIFPLNAARKVALLSKCPLKVVGGGHLSYIESYSNVREIVYFID